MNNLIFTSSKDMFADIVSELFSDSFFRQFQFRKSDSTLLRKDRKLGISKGIQLEHWGDPVFRDLTIRPVYRIRFNILHKWFEKLSHRSLQDERDTDSIGFWTNMIFEEEIDGFRYGDLSTYLFPLYDSVAGYKERIDILKRDIKFCTKYVFDNFDTLKKMYNKCIVPILKNGTEAMAEVGSVNLFIYLALCRIVCPDQYEEFKKLALQHIENMINKEDLNFIPYEFKIDEIFNSLESHDFSNVDINATC